MKYVYHVHLRDTNKKALQVRVGQGEIEYGRLITLLQKLKYNRAFSVNITEMPEVDHVGELRKLAAAAREPALGRRHSSTGLWLAQRKEAGANKAAPA